MTTETPLKPAHRAFVEAFKANGGDREAAAKAAGFSGGKKALNARALELLKRPDVTAALAELEDVDAGDVDQDERPPIADRAERQRFWTLVMRGEDERGGLLKVGMRDRLEASRLLARVAGDFVDAGDEVGPPDEVDALRWVPLRKEGDAPIRADDDLDGKKLNADLAKSIEAGDATRRQ